MTKLSTEEQATLVDGINQTFARLGIADRYRLSWDDELCNEGIVVGTVTDIDTRDEFVYAFRVRRNGSAPFDVYAERDARRFLRDNLKIGDFIRIRVYFKPASFDTGFNYFHVNDEEAVLQLIHEGGADND